MNARHFKSTADFRAWLEAHGTSTSELWVRFYKKASGRGGMTYKEALDEALCFGWIDGVRKGLDDESFAQRFSPRTSTSVWSAINLKRIKELLAEGRVAGPGRDAYERRNPNSTNRYSFENKPAAFEPALARRFKANRAAWSFFAAQPPGYRKVLTFWVMSAKKEETRLRRLDSLIESSAEGKRISWM
ncbi:MAG TPA: YdeI/OmpD-associated family protein [Vicinamibacterales bacterium]|nr:YdeI/OmpD-associated family protein [Vicinamibacterales bacterium]